MSAATTPPSDIDKLIGDLIDGLLDQAGMARLEAILEADPQVRQRYYHLMSVHTSLNWRFGNGLQNASEASLHPSLLFEVAEEQAREAGARGQTEPDWITQCESEINKEAQAKASGEINKDSITAGQLVSLAGYLLGQALTSKPAYKVYGVAAAILVAVTLFLVYSGGDDNTVSDPLAGQTSTPDVQIDPPSVPALSVVATLTQEHDAVWDRQPGGDLYANQTLTLTAGFAEITTTRGAVAILEAPATIELIDHDNALRLHAGKLVGICETDSSKGFLVRTPHMDITDLGTRFGVDATSPQATEAHVLEGVIRVKAKGLTSSRELSAGNAIAVDDAGGVSPIRLAASGFVTPEQLGLNAMPAAYETLRSDPAMIAYWGFEADDLRDGKVLNRAKATPGRMHGTLGQADKPDSSPTLTAGRFPGTSALRFEASEFDLVRIPASDASALNGLERFTIGLWVRPDHMDQESHHLVTKRTVNGNARDILNFGLAWDVVGSGYQGNSLFFHSQPVGPGFTRSFTADTLVRDTRWIHLMVTFDRGERCLYIDGQLIERLPRQGADRLAASDAELLIGASMIELDDPGTYLDGDLDELFILGRVMSAEEIQALYRSGVPNE